MGANRLLIRMTHYLNNVYIVFFGEFQDARKYCSIQSISKPRRKLGAAALEVMSISLSQINDPGPLVSRFAALSKPPPQDTCEFFRRNLSDGLGVTQRFFRLNTLGLQLPEIGRCILQLLL